MKQGFEAPSPEASGLGTTQDLGRIAGRSATVLLEPGNELSLAPDLPAKEPSLVPFVLRRARVSLNESPTAIHDSRL